MSLRLGTPDLIAVGNMRCGSYPERAVVIQPDYGQSGQAPPPLPPSAPRTRLPHVRSHLDLPSLLLAPDSASPLLSPPQENQDPHEPVPFKPPKVDEMSLSQVHRKKGTRRYHSSSELPQSGQLSNPSFQSHGSKLSSRSEHTCEDGELNTHSRRSTRKGKGKKRKAVNFENRFNEDTIDRSLQIALQGEARGENPTRPTLDLAEGQANQVGSQQYSAMSGETGY